MGTWVNTNGRSVGELTPMNEPSKGIGTISLGADKAVSTIDQIETPQQLKEFVDNVYNGYGRYVDYRSFAIVQNIIATITHAFVRPNLLVVDKDEDVIINSDTEGVGEKAPAMAAFVSDIRRPDGKYAWKEWFRKFIEDWITNGEVWVYPQGINRQGIPSILEIVKYETHTGRNVMVRTDRGIENVDYRNLMHWTWGTYRCSGTVNTDEICRGNPPLKIVSAHMNGLGYTENYIQDFFKSGLFSGSIVSSDAFNVSDKKNMRDFAMHLLQWKQQGNGIPLLMPSGLNTSELPAPSIEVALRTRNDYYIDLCRAFPFPYQLAQVPAQTAGNNMEHAQRQFYDYTIAPLLDAVENEFNTFIINNASVRGRFRFDRSVFMTRNEITQAVQNGIMSQREARRVKGIYSTVMPELVANPPPQLTVNNNNEASE